MADNNSIIDVNALLDRIKEYIKKGNASRVKITRGDNVILNVPLNAGIAGGILALYTAPLALIAGTVASLGFNCKIKLETTEGEEVDLTETSVGQKATDISAQVVDKVKDVISSTTAEIKKDKSIDDESIDDYIEAWEFKVDDEESDK